MSINDLLVPNNFDIQFPGKVTATSVTAFSNKTLTDASNVMATDNLWCGGKTALINVSAAVVPTAGALLTATSATTTDWIAPSIPGVAVNQGFAVNVVEDGARKTLWDSGALADGLYACSGIVAANPSNVAGLSAYRPGACVLISGGIASLRGNGIENNIGGVGAGAVSLVPLFTVSGADNHITLSGGDAAGTTIDFAGTIQLVQIL